MTVRVVSNGGGVQSTAMMVMAWDGHPRHAEFVDACGGPVDAFVWANVGDDSEHPASVEFIRSRQFPWGEAHGLTMVETRRVKRDGSTPTLLEHVERSERSLPIPVRMANGAPGRRSCTVDYKIKVVDRWCRDQTNDRALVAAVAANDTKRTGGAR